MKLIKFDFLMAGQRITDIDSLRGNFSPEIYEHMKSGLLEKWLKSRKMHEQADRVSSYKKLGKREAIISLSNEFSVEIDDQILDLICNTTQPTSETMENIRYKLMYEQEISAHAETKKLFSSLAKKSDADDLASLIKELLTRSLCNVPFFNRKDGALINKYAIGDFIKSTHEEICRTNRKDANSAVYSPGPGKIVATFKSGNFILNDIIGYFEVSLDDYDDFCYDWFSLKMLLERKTVIFNEFSERCSDKNISTELEKDAQNCILTAELLGKFISECPQGDHQYSFNEYIKTSRFVKNETYASL